MVTGLSSTRHLSLGEDTNDPNMLLQRRIHYLIWNDIDHCRRTWEVEIHNMRPISVPHT